MSPSDAPDPPDKPPKVQGVMEHYAYPDHGPWDAMEATRKAEEWRQAHPRAGRRKRR